MPVKFFNKTKKKKIITIGFSGSGKTTLILHLETDAPVIENPRSTLGIDYRDKTISINQVDFSMIDITGDLSFQEIFYQTGMGVADAIVYMIDGVLKPGNELFPLSVETFNYSVDVLPDDKPILIVINKQDLEEDNPLTVQEASDLYQIDIKFKRSRSQPERQYNIFPGSARYGDGILEAFTWLIDNFEK